MGIIQNSINQTLGTVAMAAGAGAHLKQQAEGPIKQELAEVAKETKQEIIANQNEISNLKEIIDRNESDFLGAKAEYDMTKEGIEEQFQQDSEYYAKHYFGKNAELGKSKLLEAVEPLERQYEANEKKYWKAYRDFNVTDEGANRELVAKQELEKSLRSQYNSLQSVINRKTALFSKPISYNAFDERKKQLDTKRNIEILKEYI